MKAVLTCLAILAASGCATVPDQKLTTESGKPELISTVSPNKIGSVVIEAMIARGYSLESESPHKLVFTRSITNHIPVGMALSVPGLTAAWETVEMTILPRETGARVIATLMFRAEAGAGRVTSYESKSPADAKTFQDFLSSIQVKTSQN